MVAGGGIVGAEIEWQWQWKSSAVSSCTGTWHGTTKEIERRLTNCQLRERTKSETRTARLTMTMTMTRGSLSFLAREPKNEYLCCEDDLTRTNFVLSYTLSRYV